MTVLPTVREARERKKPPMTQEQLALKSGVDQTYISLVERLLRNPSDDIKKRLAKALGTAPSKLRFLTAPEPAAIGTRTSDRSGHAERRTA
jgi:transcriptional regulator with XRE-family HTH domain